MIVDKEIKEISEKTGINIEEINTFVDDWVSPVTKKGLIIKLNIQRWRATEKIDIEDVGLENEEEDSFYDDYMKFGSKMLLTKKSLSKMSSMESRARKNLSNHGFHTIWGYFIPYTAYNSWREENSKIKEDFFKVAKEIYDNFDQEIIEVIEEYKKHIKKIYKKEKHLDYINFENKMVEELKKSIITKDQFLNSFSYKEEMFFIPKPSDVQKDILELEKIKEERECFTEIIQQAKETKKKYMEQFIDSTFFEIRKMILSVVEDVRNAFENNQEDPTIGTNRKKLLQMIKKIKLLNFYDDEEIRYILDKMEIDLEKDKEDRSVDDVMKSVKQIEKISKSGIKNILGGRFGLLEF